MQPHGAWPTQFLLDSTYNIWVVSPLVFFRGVENFSVYLPTVGAIPPTVLGRRQKDHPA